MGLLEDYSLVLMGGRYYIGRHRSGFLDPAYEADVQYMQDGQGNFGLLRRCLPIAGSTSLRTIAVHGPIWPCKDMSAKEREAWSNAIRECEAIITAIRSAESGIVAAPAASMAHLPPPPGEGPADPLGILRR